MVAAAGGAGRARLSRPAVLREPPWPPGGAFCPAGAGCAKAGTAEREGQRASRTWKSLMGSLMGEMFRPDHAPPAA